MCAALTAFVYNSCSVSKDYINHTANVRGKAAYIAESRDAQKGNRDCFRFGEVNVEDMIAEGDKVVYRWSGWFESQSGERQNGTGVDIKRIVNGKIKEQWYWVTKVE